MQQVQNESEQLVISRVKSWLEKVVIGLNFCPFAKKEFERQTIRYCLDSNKQQADSLSYLIDELALLDGDPNIETTLIIYPQNYQQFDDYLDWLSLASSLVESGGYRGIYQLASFHPDYCFDGEDVNDPANYTNRSPYPIIHILREASLSRVLNHYPDPESIPERNMAKARQLGVVALRKLMA
ncbi:DUF1415 domain-containing protein [Paraglaciecola hydrolytica]|uniref:DUF1415 domain-containing protein n=1 Tax=Paraglaciecola hydrolytica TaxID=1799789 RepID=A0A136A0M0_9ALTE|nr:DUF1415 domain-containing protein [Paraglaciecola hydrolytica]KXI28700.1 hypothetical protein AX660_16650 [Paraglaciecola hydrolytica]